MRKSIFFFLLLQFFSALASHVDTSDRSGQNRDRLQEMESTYNSLANGEPKDGQMAWLHGQTHRAFSTSSVEASILVPDTIQYGESLGFIVMICAIIGLVAAVIGWITHSMSYCKEDHCRWTCGQDDNVICKWLPFVFIVILTIVVAILLIVSWTIEGRLEGAISEGVDFIEVKYQAEVERYEYLRALSEDVSTDADWGNFVSQSLQEGGVEIETHTGDVVSWGRSSDLGRRITLAVIGILIIVGLVLGVLGGLIRKAGILKCAALVMWFNVLFLFIGLGLHMGLATGSADICHDSSDVATTVAAINSQCSNVNSTGCNPNAVVTVEAGDALDCMTTEDYVAYRDNYNTMAAYCTVNDPRCNDGSLIPLLLLRTEEVYSCIWVAEILMESAELSCSDVFDNANQMAVILGVMAIFCICLVVPYMVLWKRIKYDQKALGASGSGAGDGTI